MRKKSLPEITGFSIRIPECSLRRFSFIAYQVQFLKHEFIVAVRGGGEENILKDSIC